MSDEEVDEPAVLANSIEKILMMRHQIQALAGTLQSVLSTLEDNGLLVDPSEVAPNGSKMKAVGSAEVIKSEDVN